MAVLLASLNGISIMTHTKGKKRNRWSVLSCENSKTKVSFAFNCQLILCRKVVQTHCNQSIAHFNRFNTYVTNDSVLPCCRRRRLTRHGLVPSEHAKNYEQKSSMGSPEWRGLARSGRRCEGRSRKILQPMRQCQRMSTYCRSAARRVRQVSCLEKIFGIASGRCQRNALVGLQMGLTQGNGVIPAYIHFIVKFLLFLYIYTSRLFLSDEKKRTLCLRFIPKSFIQIKPTATLHRRQSSFIEPVRVHWKNIGLEDSPEDRRRLHHTTNCHLQIELVPHPSLAMIARLIEWSSRYLVFHHSHTCIVWILSSTSSPFCFLINEPHFFPLSNEKGISFLPVNSDWNIAV